MQVFFGKLGKRFDGYLENINFNKIRKHQFSD